MSQSDSTASPSVGNRKRDLLLTGQHSDVTFIVGNHHGSGVQTYRAHKRILLGSGSAVFQRMLDGETGVPYESVFQVADVAPEAFLNMLWFLYTDTVENLTLDTAFTTISCGDKYGLPLLCELCWKFITSNVNKDNCLMIIQKAEEMSAPEVVKKCLELIDTCGAEVLLSDGFRTITRTILEMILKRDSLTVNEKDIFEAVKRWAKHACAVANVEASEKNCREMLGSVFFLVQFPLMAYAEILDAYLAGWLKGREVGQICASKYAADGAQPSKQFTGTRKPASLPTPVQPQRHHPDNGERAERQPSVIFAKQHRKKASAYDLFCAKERKRIRAADPKGNCAPKEMARRWHAADYATKQHFQRLAQFKKAHMGKGMSVVKEHTRTSNDCSVKTPLYEIGIDTAAATYLD
ncbi:BTB/POZ domain-containing protein 1-like [Paramacrobiotus metropolitanus]|uniref:BTB/POZ domain-containing protein 1-like n=1 Tax=Paramacrobiotus metropolitanus TaxID=2943436 RepID=UPI002445F98C|nr:BTB/POZ domain-containing protein 1-like [Paramacrobiotus metropolitanus]